MGFVDATDIQSVSQLGLKKIKGSLSRHLIGLKKIILKGSLSRHLVGQFGKANYVFPADRGRTSASPIGLTNSRSLNA